MRRSSRHQTASAVGSGNPDAAPADAAAASSAASVRDAAPAAAARPVVSRAELRRRGAQSRPAAVWGHPRPAEGALAASADESTPAGPAETAARTGAPAGPVVPVVTSSVAVAAAWVAPVVAAVADGGDAAAVLAHSSVSHVEKAPLTRRRARELARAGEAGSTAGETAALIGHDAPAVVPEELPVPAEASASDIDDSVFTEAVLDADSSAIADEFEAAARLFAFTGQTPVQVAAAAIDDDGIGVVAPTTDATPHEETSKRGRGRSAGASFRRVAASSATIGVMGLVGLLAVGMTTPAEAVAAASDGVTSSVSLASSKISEDEIQAYVAPANAASGTLDRSDYAAVSVAQLAAASGISHYSDFFTNNANSNIQWPFPVGVSISYGFGMRDGTMHEGLDFTPGEGAEIQAIADGTVRIATESGGGYGVMIIIDHIIDGKLVSTRYGHMQYGSLKVKTGDTVHVGQIIGLVGDTGHSFGAHLHFEVLDNGTTAIDPLPWLREYTDGTHTVG